jgi:hypothetical protein
MTVTRSGILSALTALLLVGPASAQQKSSLGATVTFQGYSFSEGLGTDVANLLMVPIAARIAAGSNLNVDFFGAWAEGRVERANQTFVLNGLVDSRIRASYKASPWAIVSLSANLPTGNATHNTEEAVVAAVLSSDILGFQESSWGTGSSLTSGVATAHQIGSWAIGLGASYRVADGFAPQADTAFSYDPGNEARFRVALDRNVGATGKFTGGVTLQRYQTDQLDGRNLFASGDRIRADIAYSFRSGGTTINLFGANVYRSSGDLSLQIVSAGAVVGDTLVATGSQNVAVMGVQAAIPVGSTVYFRPTADLRIQTVKTPGDDPDLGGWIAGFGGDLPLRIFGSLDFFPRARISVGKLKDAAGVSRSFWGVETSGTLRIR